jgi:hypothetical protein
MSLAESLERAAEALPEDAEEIRPANGDPFQLLDLLDDAAGARVLEWLFINQLDSGEELASAWLEEEEGAAIVVSVPEAGLSKPGRKALRRLVHQARSRGVEVVDDSGGVPHVGRLPDLNEKISMGYVSPYDPRGGRLVYIVESSPSGGARVFEALLDADRGIVDFQAYRAGRRQVGDFVRDLTRRSRFPAVEADPGSVRTLIRRHRDAQSPDAPFPKTFLEWRVKLDLEGNEVATPGEQARNELGDEIGVSSMEALVAEVSEGRLGPWPPASPVLEKVVTSLGDEFSIADRNHEALEARLEEELQRLYLDGDTAIVNAERFEETAYPYWKSGERGIAGACLATADRLRGVSSEASPVVAALIVGVRSALKQELEQKLGWTEEAGPVGSSQTENSNG